MSDLRRVRIAEDAAFADALAAIGESEYLAAAIPSLESWSRRVDIALERCPQCGGQPLREAASVHVRCSCGWTGVALRRLP